MSQPQAPVLWPLFSYLALNMRCTRWFLPLVILPLPTAPPYFVAIFLLSMFLHARPCFYCMMLLTALFTSSCYWQGVPVDAPLTRPLGNATTFGEAVLANISLPPQLSAQNYSAFLSSANSDVYAHLNLDSDSDSEGQIQNGEFDRARLLPPFVQLVDRCWCNIFSRNGLFEPADVSRWEWESVQLARRGVEEKVKAIFAPAPSDTVKDGEKWRTEGVEADDEFTKRMEEKDDEAREGIDGDKDPQSIIPGSPFSLHGLRNFLFPTLSASNAAKYRLKQPSSTFLSSSQSSSSQSSTLPTSEAQPIPTEDAPPDSSIPDDISNEGTDSIQTPSVPEQPMPTPPASPAPKLPLTKKLFRPFYDLRPYGIDITLDFRWKR